MQQVSTRSMQFNEVEAQAVGAPRGIDERVTDAVEPASSSAWGIGQLSPNGIAEEATVCHAPSPEPSGPPPSHGILADALRPASQALAQPRSHPNKVEDSAG
jgi:hypothetical protein